VGFDVVRTRRGTYAAFLGVAAVLGVGGSALFVLRGDRGEPGDAAAAYDRTAIAVLPFENLSAQVEHAYFAPGLHDELITQLSKVAELKVIGRTSVMSYESTGSPLRKIATELGVGGVVEGSVQVVGDRLRVNVQLIDAVTETNIWAERYDGALEDAFEIQSEIAQQIVAAVVPTLGPAQQQLLADLPTENAQAYEHYLLGMARFRAGFPAGPALLDAVAMLEKAVELDPAFALAHARLSMSHAGVYWGNRDPTEERLKQARDAADRALQIRPDLLEGRLALGLYWYWGHRNYDRALHELNPLLTLHPDNGELIYIAAGVQRRAGRLTEAAANFAKASDLDPLWWSAALEAGATFLALRQYELAERYLRRLDAIDASPRLAGWVWAYLRLMRGDRAEDVRRWLQQRGGAHSFDEEMAAAAHAGTYLEDGWRVVRSLCGDCEDALRWIRADNREWLQPGDPMWRYYVANGVLSASMKRSALARTYFDSAATELELDALAPHTPGLKALAYVYAALGRGRAAMRAAEEQARALPVQKDAWSGTDRELAFAEISLLAGEYELALDKLEWLLSVPSLISAGILRADPIWDPIRDLPRFQRLVANGRP
jgi:serine/threonine-protein kinase